MPSKHLWLVSGFMLVQCLGGLTPGNASAQDAGAVRPPSGADLLQQQAAGEEPAAEGEPEGETPAAAPTPDDGKTRLGPFVLDAGTAVSQGYTDNVFATRNDKVGDGLTVITPEVSLTTEGLPLDLELFGSAEIGRHWDETSEDYEDFDFGLDTTYRITPQSAIFGGVSFGRDHEERQSPDDVNGDEPTLFYDSQAFLGTNNRFGNVTLRAGGTFEQLNFDDVDAAGGRINNDDRDRDLYTAGARVGYMVAPGYEIFGQGLFDLRDYHASHDDFGFDRDSEGFSAAAGLRYRPDATLDAEAFVGLLSQDYDDSSFATTTEPDFGLQVTWRPQPTTRIRGFVDRSLQETTLSGSSGYLSTAYGVSLIQQIRPDLSFETSLSYYESDYKGLDREDTTLDLGLGGRYYITPNFFLATNYSFLQRDSTVASEDYDEHQIFFSLGAELSPAFDEDALAAAPQVMADLSGLYVGVQGSLPNLGTELAGPRGAPGGTLTSELADFGIGGGPFLGYALRAGDWQFGLEIDGEISDVDWGHVRDMGGRIYSVEREWSISAGPVVGYWLNDDSMIYGRFGIVEAGFDTDYIESGNSYGESRTLMGMRVGVGAETTLTGNLFLRLDYSYTDYEDYDITYSGGRDNFANNESLVRLGLGYRFPGGEKQDANAGAENQIDLAGFYIGAGGGQNRLNSKNTGDRQAGSTLEVDAGEGGATGGLFGGYGVVWHNVYLGAEAEAEISDVTWEREREPTGRVFEIDKEGGIGAALRAGYVLPGGALAYARAGVMYSKFNTEVTTTGNHFEEDEYLLGLRVGGGLELPISEDFFARLEYTYTEYEDSSLATGSGPEDFENSEGLFRAAVGFRF